VGCSRSGCDDRDQLRRSVSMTGPSFAGCPSTSSHSADVAPDHRHMEEVAGHLASMFRDVTSEPEAGLEPATSALQVRTTRSTGRQEPESGRSDGISAHRRACPGVQMWAGCGPASRTDVRLPRRSGIPTVSRVLRRNRSAGGPDRAAGHRAPRTAGLAGRGCGACRRPVAGAQVHKWLEERWSPVVRYVFDERWILTCKQDPTLTVDLDAVAQDAERQATGLVCVVARLRCRRRWRLARPDVRGEGGAAGRALTSWRVGYDAEVGPCLAAT
jgi:hypothetical protein